MVTTVRDLLQVLTRLPDSTPVFVQFSQNSAPKTLRIVEVFPSSVRSGKYGDYLSDAAVLELRDQIANNRLDDSLTDLHESVCVIQAGEE